MGSIIRPSHTSGPIVGIPAAPAVRRRAPAADEPPTPMTEQGRRDKPAARPPPQPAATQVDPVGLGDLANALISERLDAGRRAEDAAKLEDARRRAEEEGFKAGERKGAEAGAARLKAEVDRLTSIARELQAQWELRIARSEDLVVEVAFAAITRMLGEAIATRDGVVAAVRQVLAQAKDNGKRMTLRLRPGDLELLGADGQARLVTAAGGALSVIADERVKLGGCLLETDRGTLDGRLEMQLERLKEALLDARQHHDA